MPKGLLYAGVIGSSLIAVFAALYAFAAFAPTAPVVNGALDGLALSRNPVIPYFFLLILACSVPVAAIFVRMSSLLAVRSLFHAFLALASLVCTMLTVCLVAIGSLRLAVHMGGPMDDASRAALRPLVEVHLISYYALGFFLSILLLAIRPWFRIQASGMLSGAMVLPSILFGWIIVEEHLLAPVNTLSGAYRSAPSFLFFVIVSAIFFGLAAHCLAHQHYFTEVTSLRQLMSPPAGPLPGGRGRLPLHGYVAYDG